MSDRDVLEDRLRQEFLRQAPHFDLGASLPTKVSARVRRRQRLRIIVPVAAVVAVLVAVAVPLASFRSSPLHTSLTPATRVTGPCAGQPPGCGTELGTASSLAAGHWSAIPAAPLSARAGQAAVWTGKELLVWGGGGLGTMYPPSFADGAAYDPATARWHRLPPAPLGARAGMAAVWTGTRAFFFGGGYTSGPRGSTHLFGDGATYNPTTRTWRLLPPSPLSPRSGATATWTGHDVIVFGGDDANGMTLDGAIYDPSTRTWALLPAFPVRTFPPVRNAPPGITVHDGPVGTTAVWTGRELLVWVDYQTFSYPAPNTEGIDDVQQATSWTPGSSSWHRLPSPPTGHYTFGATAVWTGSNVLLLNGSYCLPSMSCPGNISNESTYDPSTGRWATIPGNVVSGGTTPLLWTGRAMMALNFESVGSGLSLGDGATLDPSLGTWTALPRSPLPTVVGASVAWTGRQVLVWGASSPAGSAEPVGEALNAQPIP